MKLVTPLDRQALIAIPSALPGKFWLGGPYKLADILREPEDYGDEDIDWRQIQIVQAHGVEMHSCWVDVTSSRHHARPSEWPAMPTYVSYKLRYLYRDEPSSTILGVVQLEVSHDIHGPSKHFAVLCTKVIQSVYVAPESRGRGIARVLLAEVLADAPDVTVHPQFSEEGAKLFGFDLQGKREPNVKSEDGIQT